MKPKFEKGQYILSNAYMNGYEPALVKIKDVTAEGIVYDAWKPGRDKVRINSVNSVKDVEDWMYRTEAILISKGRAEFLILLWTTNDRQEV